MHATIDVRFELSIDDDKTLPLATLAEAVTDLPSITDYKAIQYKFEYSSVINNIW